MRKTILGSLTSLLIPFAAYGANISYGAYQRRQSTYIGTHQPLPLANGRRHSFAERTLDLSAAELDITAGSPVRELMIIDAAVPDKAVLQSAVRPGIETFFLKAGEDALEQTAALLQNYTNLDAVHLVSHGEAGAILLGDRRIDKHTLETHPHFLEALGQATRAGADLLLYACDVASEDAELLEVIQQNSHLDIAASNNLTGAAGLGGDWTLEIQAGNIETTQAFSEKALEDFSSVLRPFGTKTFETLTTQVAEINPSIDFGDFVAFITSTQTEYLNGINAGACIDDLYVNMLYQPTSKFYIRSDPSGESFGVTQLILRRANSYNTTSVNIEGFTAIGDTISVVQKNGVSLPAGQGAAVVDLTTGVTGSGSFAEVAKLRITPNDATFCINSISFTELDSDGNVAAAAGVTEPVGLSTTIDGVGEAVDVFDFTISDGGTSDDQPLTVSQLFLSVTGTSTDDERGQIAWRLNGPDASNVTGTYDPATDRITFSGLSLSIADGGSETYTVNAYYNNNTNITDGSTVILSIDGDTNLTVGSGGTQMGSTSPVTNGTGTTLDVVATQLVFTTQPGGSVSGAALTQQPVVAAQDDFGNTDRDFTETITLTEASAGALSNNTQAAVNGVATFTNLIYTATADQQGFTLTANDQDGAGSNLPTVNSNSVTSNVVATKLVFTTQPAPTSISSGVATGFTTVPVVSAMDSNDIVDSDYVTPVVLSVTDPNDGTVDGTVNSLTGTGDTDVSGTTVTLTPSSGVATYTDLQLTYTAGGGSDTIALRAASGGLTADISNNITALANNPPTDIALSASDINQSSTGAGAAVGTLSTTDADVADTHTYSLAANDASNNGSCGAAGDDGNASFQIDNSNDELETAGSLSPGSYSVCIQTSDGEASYQESFTITVTDDVAPTVDSVFVPADATYIAGQNLDFTVNTSENVTVDISGGKPQISLTVGATARQAVYLSGSGTSALVFRYTVQAGDLDTDGITVGALSANGGTLRDGGDNDLDTTLNSVGSTANVRVDGVAPAISSVGVPANDTYSAVQNLDFTVNTDENVTVDTAGGTPRIALTVGATARFANYVNGSGTSALLFRYTVQAGDNDSDGIAVNTLEANGGTLRDSAGNDLSTTLNGVGSTTNVLVDTVAPSGHSVSFDDGAISGAEAASIGFTFAGAEVGADYSYTISSSGGGTPVSDTGTIAAAGQQIGDIDVSGLADGTLTLSVTLTDGAGNSAVAVTDTATLDTQAPLVDSVSLPANATYISGQNLDFTVNYDEAVTVTGTPRLELTVGATARFANYVSGSGTSALLFRYTVQAGDVDADGIALNNTLQSNGGTLRDAAGNDAATALGAIGSLTAVLVDAQVPSVNSVTLPANATYTAGQNLDFTVNYDEAVTVNTGGGTPRLALTVGAAARFANYVSGSGSTALVFRYTVQAGDNDSDGIALNNTLQSNGGTLRDASGNDAGTSLGATGSLAGVLVDAQAPSVDSVNLPADGSYLAGQNLDFTVNYDEAVTVTGTPRLALTVGATARHANYVGGSGTTALLFRYTAQAGDNDGDGIALNTTLDVNGGTLRDTAGNDASVNLGAIGSLAAVLVDTQAPSVTSVTLPGNATYTGGQNLDFTVNYDEAVTVTGTPRLALTIGTTARQANYVSGSGTTALLFRYTVQSGDNDGDGIALNATLDTNGGTLQDAAGNTAGTALGAIGSLTSVLVDTQGPSVNSVTLPADGIYLVGQNLDFTVNYDEAVTVNTAGGTPRLELTVGATARFANYVSGSGTTALLFRYTVQAGDNDNDGIALNTTLDANGGTLRDATNVSANVDLGTIGSLAGVLVDAQAPSLDSVTLPADGSYREGQNLDFTVNYDEAVTVDTAGGTPRLVLTVGATTRYADYVSGSGGTALVFRHTVQAGDNDSDGIALNVTLDANGGTLKDAADNDADTNLGAIGDLTAVLVDTQSPSITSVTLPVNATYLLGENLDFTVNYDETVTVTGTPRLALTIGATTRYAGYVSGSGTNALLFRYTAQNGDSDGDGIELDTTLDANGGTLRDAAGNDAGTDLGANDLSGVLVDALDTDGDGVSDVQEGIDGTDPNDPDDYLDDTAPVVTAPADLVVDATGLYTTVTLRQLLGLAPAATDEEVQQAQAALATDNIDGADCCNTQAQGLENGRILLQPGQTQIVWQGSDRKGNNGQAAQNVNVRPLVSVGKDQTGVEGSPIDFRVMLNGPSPFYPLEVPFVIETAESSADNADHDLVDGTVTFNAGETEASVTINLTDDMLPEGDEVLVVRLDDQTDDSEDLAGGYDPLNINDINSGAVTQQTITITESNVAPNVALNMQQNAVNVALVANNGGDVTVTANVTDPNTGDTHSYDWSGTDPQLMDTDGDAADATFVFDPALLSAGVHTVQVSVTDSGGATATRLLHFSVVAEAPVLDPLNDTDGDGVDDVTEGIADSDGDSIPDYQDNIADGNLLPETADVTDAYLIECEPGVRCRRGRASLLSEDGGARISTEDLPADTLYTNIGGVFDFEIHDLPVAGQSARVVIPQIAAIPADAAYRKFANDQWFTFVEDANNALHSAPGEAGFCPPPGDASWEPGLVEGYLCVQLTIEDGGANDADGLANGSVEDPGGVGQPVAVNPPPGNGSSWTIRGSTKGGGGALGLPAGLALLLLVLLRHGRRAAKVCGLLAALLASAAQAQENGEPNVNETPSGWQRLLDGFAEKGYLTLGLYTAEGDQKRGGFVDGMADYGVTVAVQEYDVSRSAYQLSLGYRYLPGMAVEFGYLDLGDVDFAFAANAANAAALSDALSQNLPVSGEGWVFANRFDYMFGKWRTSADLGLYFWDGKAVINDPTIDAHIKDGTDPLLGLQVAYPLPGQFELALQYRRILFDDQNVELWGGGLSWSF